MGDGNRPVCSHGSADVSQPLPGTWRVKGGMFLVGAPSGAAEPGGCPPLSVHRHYSTAHHPSRESRQSEGEAVSAQSRQGLRGSASAEARCADCLARRQLPQTARSAFLPCPLLREHEYGIYSLFPYAVRLTLGQELVSCFCSWMAESRAALLNTNCPRTRVVFTAS